MGGWVGGGMRASDIGGVGGPGATPAPGLSPQQHRLQMLPLPQPGIGVGGCVGGSGERGRRWGGGGLRASDIGGVGVVAGVLFDCHGGRCRRFGGERADSQSEPVIQATTGNLISARDPSASDWARIKALIQHED